MNLVSLQRMSANNQDVCNEKLSAKQDCSDILNIAIFFDGTGNNYEADIAEKNGPIQLVYGEMLSFIKNKMKL